ncbi:patatin-like phospholipase family protein [uncultured Thiodictyon sp.]|uniref:patatin-like phospholipase family protein n=1 Tax=uncultured Thiodictyon sp. TaxID=1846217 RepID=UPI0025F6CCF9|nr:patatin-like phospholipase family protein [uncultured Thiodictyon sp.]
MSNIEVGLVLSGGGAKGAYHVGVLKALLEMGVRINAIAGASIGALNGAVLASAPSLKVGVERMDNLWNTLANTPPLAPHFPAYLHLLLAAGLRINKLDYIVQLAGLKQAEGIGIPFILELLSVGLLSSNPLIRLMEQYFDPDALEHGLPLYVSVFKSCGPLEDTLMVLMAESGILESPESEFLHIQRLPKDQQKDALLGSAAIPLLFAPRHLNNSIYSDGGIGGWQRMQGNTPVTPLLQAGINTLIVTHLCDGSLWSRHDFPEAMILEIRPQSPIGRSGGLSDLLGFDAHKIPSWIEQGYRDTLHCVGRVIEATTVRNKLRFSEAKLNNDEDQFMMLDKDLSEAMGRLENPSGYSEK